MNLESHKHHHVVIIGGGAVGLCSAYYLREAGAEVTVIDKGELGHGSSQHNAGYVCPSHFIPLASPGIISQGLKWMLNPISPFYVKPRLNRDFLAWAWRFRQSCTAEHVRRVAPLLRDLHNRSLELYREFAAMKAFDFEWTEKGLMIVYRTDHGRHLCEEEAELSEELGVEVTMLDQAGVQALEPEVEMRAHGGLYYPGDCHLTPAKFVEGLARLLERKGVRLLPHTTAVRLRATADRVTEVETSNGALQADEFVLAGGSWSPGIVRSLGMRLLVEAGKGYSITIERKERKPTVPFICFESRVAVTPMGNTLRYAGTMEIAGVDTSITRRRVDAILNAVPLYMGGVQPSDFNGATPWAGLRPVSPDGVPYIGRFKAYPNLIAATGHAMIGMSLAPVTGRIVADIIAGKTVPFDLGLLSPDRFRSS
jgi:D-amino-acid dehydrogenase